MFFPLMIRQQKLFRFFRNHQIASLIIVLGKSHISTRLQHIVREKQNRLSINITQTWLSNKLQRSFLSSRKRVRRSKKRKSHLSFFIDKLVLYPIMISCQYIDILPLMIEFNKKRKKF